MENYIGGCCENCTTFSVLGQSPPQPVKLLLWPWSSTWGSGMAAALQADHFQQHKGTRDPGTPPLGIHQEK